nr:sulfurtransferase [Propionibacteriales bacterium]
DHDLARPADEHGRHPMPLPRDFEQSMRRCGIHRGVTAVCYDGDDSTSAARAWWLLGYFGHDATRVLDGGYAAWVRSGGATSVDEPPPGEGEFEARPGQLQLLTADDAGQVAHDGRLLDARAAGRYEGSFEPVDPVAGHIPGAVSAPTLDNVGPDGRFLPEDELRARFAALGVRSPAHCVVAAYCGSGVTAAHEVLALQLAGVDAGLYADSWSGWITDHSRPVATGSNPA